MARNAPAVSQEDVRLLFAPPPEITATIWARLPDSLRVTRPRTPWKALRFPHKPHSFLEGPAFDRAGNLYVVDVPHGRILRISPDAEFSVVAEYDGEPNGLKIHRDGTIWIADFRHGIMTLDPATGTVRPVVTHIDSAPLKGPNDLVFSRAGDLYFTDQGASGLTDPTGRVVCRRSDGTIEIILDNAPSPNGLVLNRAETTLFLAVTRGNAIWRVPLPPRGQRPSKVGLAIQLSGGNGPDGLAMDEADSLFVAQPIQGCVWGFDRRGEPIWRIRGGDDPTNLAFGGPDRRDLFITEAHAGVVLRAELPVPGQAMFSHD